MTWEARPVDLGGKTIPLPGPQPPKSVPCWIWSSGPRLLHDLHSESPPPPSRYTTPFCVFQNSNVRKRNDKSTVSCWFVFCGKLGAFPIRQDPHLSVTAVSSFQDDAGTCLWGETLDVGGAHGGQALPPGSWPFYAWLGQQPAWMEIKR